MKYTLLGNTGMKISRLGFGGIPIQHLSQEEACKVVQKALEEGINFFDTARSYTVSENYLGHALKDKMAEVYLATKAPARGKDKMLSDVELSLKDLQTDYIDLYQLHNVGSVEDLEREIGEDGAYRALEQLKDQGVIGHIGITTHKEEVLEMALDLDIFETIQFPLNVVESQGKKAFELAVKKGIGTIAMKPLAGGALDKAFDSLRYILEFPYLNVAIPGMDTIDQVLENVKAVNADKLTKSEREELIAMAQELGEAFCRRCGYCLPCTEGIDIPGVFLMEGYYTRYDLKDWSQERYDSLENNAGDCSECGTCESRCPYELPIMEMMREAHRVFQQE